MPGLPITVMSSPFLNVYVGATRSRARSVSTAMNAKSRVRVLVEQLAAERDGVLVIGGDKLDLQVRHKLIVDHVRIRRDQSRTDEKSRSARETAQDRAHRRFALGDNLRSRESLPGSVL